jgi:hypothetical protein
MRAIVLLFGFLPFLIFAEGQTQLTVGPLILPLTGAWQTNGNSLHLESHGPNGQTLIASYAALVRGVSPDPTTQVLQKAREVARDLMPGLAAKNGKVVRPVTESPSPESRIVFSAASAGKRMFRDYYFLQYLLTAKQGLVYITVEGYGDALQAAASFDEVLRDSQWTE